MEAIKLEKVTESQKPSVFEHLDYRNFIQAYYQYKKDVRTSFSYRLFAQQAGFNSPNYVKLIASGSRNLTRINARRIAQACKMKKSELRYFMALVEWNQAKCAEDKETFWLELIKCAPKSEIHILNQSQTQIITRWYIIALLEMIRLKDFKNDPYWISKRFSGHVSPKQVAEAFHILKKEGLVEEINGRLQFTQKIVFAGGDTPSQLIQSFHARNIPVGINKLLTVNVTKREYTASSIAVKEEDIPALKEEIRKFHDKIMQISATQTDADHIYQLNLQFFPLTTDGAK